MSRRSTLKQEMDERAQDYLRAVLYPGWNRDKAKDEFAAAALKWFLFEQGYRAGARTMETE